MSLFQALQLRERGHVQQATAGDLLTVLRLVQDMRRAQQRAHLQESKALERLVDGELETLAGALR